MNNFNKNPFGNVNSNMNQTRIVSKYNQVSKDGGRVSTEDVRKNMQQLKGNDVKITVFPNAHEVRPEQPRVESQTSSIPQTPSVKPANSFGRNNVDQMKMARDRMNNFRNMGKF